MWKGPVAGLVLCLLTAASGCRSNQPHVVHVFRDRTSSVGQELDQRFYEFGMGKISLPSGRPILIATIEPRDHQDYQEMLRNRIGTDLRPDLIVLDAPADAAANPIIQQENTRAVNICAAVRACPAVVPAFVPSWVPKGEERDAAQQVLNALSERGRTALLTAARNGDLAQAKRLLLDGEPVDEIESGTGMTPLHYAAESKNLGLVVLLIQRGANINAKASGNVTPLMLSVDMARGEPDIALELIKAGADVSAADANGDTAVIIATTESSYGVLKALLEKGANPNARGLDGRTALHYAAMNGLTEEAALLIRYGADPTIRDSAGQSAIDVAKSPSTDPAVQDNFAKTRKLLLAASQKKTK